MGTRARDHVLVGEHVVLDATFRFAADRRAFADAFGSAARLAWIECRAPADVLIARAGTRARGISDAGPSIAAVQAREWEPLGAPCHLVVRTDRDRRVVLTAVRDALDARLRGELRSHSVV